MKKFLWCLLLVAVMFFPVSTNAFPLKTDVLNTEKTLSCMMIGMMTGEMMTDMNMMIGGTMTDMNMMMIGGTMTATNMMMTMIGTMTVGMINQ